MGSSGNSDLCMTISAGCQSGRTLCQSLKDFLISKAFRMRLGSEFTSWRWVILSGDEGSKQNIICVSGGIGNPEGKERGAYSWRLWVALSSSWLARRFL